jgi:hypothetical protein
MSVKGHDERFGILPNTRQSGSLELRLRCIVHFLRAVRIELRSKTGLSWKQRLGAWRRGFSSESWKLYDLPENNPDLYLPDLSSLLRFYRINGFFNPIIGDKLLLSRLLTAHRIPHPDVVSIILGGRLIEEGAPFDPDMPRVLSRTLVRYPRQVFRPTWSGNGHGLFFLSRDDDGLKLNGEKLTLDEACVFLSGLDRYLATEFLEQEAYAEKIYPGSANTLRILTLWDMKRGEPFVAAISHRFGSSRSGLIDNWHGGRGGLCAPVDQKTSILGQAATQSADHKMVRESSHPETGEAIEGVLIPGLNNAIEGVLGAAVHFPFCPCIGWDVLLTGGSFSILEANPISGLTIVQVHTPLLKDPRSRAFFQYWGMSPGKKVAKERSAP